tara:strand:- start:4191 stop:5021 length:831 start_codon:yes stop_codon:yes gene_type:complete
MPNPYNEIEISEEEAASVVADANPTQEEKGSETVSEESSNQEVTESNDQNPYGLFDNEEDRYIEIDEIHKWRESYNNMSDWQKSNTEKAQNIAKWGRFMEKVESDEDFRSHISEYFGDDKNTINSFGLNGIEAIKEAVESSEENTETQEPKLQSLEERVNAMELDKRTDVLEVQFNQFVESNKSAFPDQDQEVKFLQFMSDKGIKDFGEAFKLWNYDNLQEQLQHSKELDKNKERNEGKVFQTKTIGATKEKTNSTIAKDYKNVSLNNPDIAKYFE